MIKTSIPNTPDLKAKDMKFIIIIIGIQVE